MTSSWIPSLVLHRMHDMPDESRVVAGTLVQSHPSTAGIGGELRTGTYLP